MVFQLGVPKELKNVLKAAEDLQKVAEKFLKSKELGKLIHELIERGQALYNAIVALEEAYPPEYTAPAVRKLLGDLKSEVAEMITTLSSLKEHVEKARKEVEDVVKVAAKIEEVSRKLKKVMKLSEKLKKEIEKLKQEGVLI